MVTNSFKSLFAVLILSFWANICTGEVFRGKIIDREGRPVPYATIYIHELTSGISTDNKGEFRISLPAGSYTCEVSSLGYKRQKFSFIMQSKDYFKEIVLEDEIYLLNDVYFRDRGEDRAYSIMRKAIARAPFHRQQVRGYESSVYLKGTMIITKIPAILKIQAGKKRSNLVLNKLFLVESHSKISYTYPNSYNEQVKAFSSTIPAEVNPGDISGVMKASIYEKEFFGYLSPLAPNAFNYYKFSYEGISNESGKIVNKIKIIPSGRDSKLFRGYIYIVDDLWSVSYLELNTKNTGIETDIKINFNEVKQEILLPTSYSMDFKVALMGVNANGRYYSSVTYADVLPGKQSVAYPNEVKINEKITTGEAKRAAKASENSLKKEIETSLKKGDKGSDRLEIKRDTSVKREVDSLARFRDTTYWSEVRRLPLREEEIISYKQADSIKTEMKKFEDEDSLKKINRSTGNKIFDKILFENRIKAGKNLTIGYGGLTKVIGGFNFTDGYQIGQNFSAKYDFNKYSAVSIAPSFYYSTLRKRLMWDLSFTATYSPMRLGRFTVSTGDKSTDISDNSSVTKDINTYATYFFGLNPVKLYSKKWIEIRNEIDILNGLRLSLSATYREATPLVNGNLKSIFGKAPDSNTPNFIYGTAMTGHKSLFYTASLSYTPEYYYRIRDGFKRYVRSRYPTFTIYTRATLPGGSDIHSSYGMAGVRVTQRFRTGLYGSFYYSADIGTFYNQKRVFPADYKHFRASAIGVTESGFSNSFLLLDNYKYSTPESWVTASIEYGSDYLILKRLPFLNSQLLYEALHLKSIWLPEKRVTHTEIGYSFGIRELIRGGFFVGFDGVGYSGYGFVLEIPILSQL
ncbi:MAG: DUF5686 and carboxypeptidase regulatory-like domain-containing protein [Bacteroidales bacterium]